jgi:hypothetical protein
MKGFLATLFVVCGVIAALWLSYDPFIRPMVEKMSGGSPLTDGDRLIAEGSKPTASEPAAPAATTTAPKGGAATAAIAAKGGAPSAVPAPAPATTAAPGAPEKPKSELETALELRYPMPEFLPLLAIVDQWRSVPANAYPPEVTAIETVPFQLVIDGQAVGASNVAPGTPLKPVRLVGDQLTVASLANPAMSTVVPVDKTDFKRRIEARYAQFVEAKRQEVEARRARVREIVASDPSRLAALTGKGGPAPTAGDDGGDPRFAAVKASLRAGEAASVTLDEAKTYHWNGSEKVGGKHAGTYDTVTVHFEVATIFGRFPVDYKALLRGGRVHAWIDPVTEDEI